MNEIPVAVPVVFRVLRWVAVLFGLVTAGTGIAHLSGVLSVAMDTGRAYDSRYVFLLTIGGILVYVGLVNVVLSWWLRKGDRFALGAATITTIAFMIFLVLLLPLPDGGSSTRGMLIGHGSYLALQVACWVSTSSRTGERLAHPPAA